MSLLSHKKSSDVSCPVLSFYLYCIKKCVRCPKLILVITKIICYRPISVMVNPPVYKSSLVTVVFLMLKYRMLSSLDFTVLQDRIFSYLLAVHNGKIHFNC